MPARLRAFVLLVVAGAVLAVGQLALRCDGWGVQRPASCLVLVGLVVLAELRPLRMTRADAEDEITLSSAFSLALTLVGGLWVSVLAMCLTVVVEDLRRGKAAVKWAFNAGQYALSLCASAVVFGLLTGQPVLRQVEPLALPGELPAALAAGAAFWATNSLLTGVVSALSLGEPVVGRLLAEVRFQAGTNGLLLSIMPVVVVCAEQSVWLLPLLVLPMSGIYVSAELVRRRQREALHDGLTGLPNRALFGLRVARLCQQADGSGTGGTGGPAGRAGGGDALIAAVMLLDLDHFKEINDTLGHQTGDQLLRAVAERLSSCLRPGDTVARLGGDEFALLSPGLDDPAQALLVAERVLRALEEPFGVDGVRLEVEASLGVALHPQDGDDIDVLLRRADIALYAAKVERSCVRVYDPTQDPHTLERLALASDLRAGLEQHQLVLHHQPKVDLTTGRVIGFEALVRWHHPRHGVLMPDDFLPVVENTGLIGPLTLEVLELALVDVAHWREAGHDVSVAVNLSVRHLTDLSLPGQVHERLAAHDLPPSALVLEVTETLIMTDPGRAVAVLTLLRELGVGLAVDDFGTGYSSLAYLRRLHVDELKIDRSFVLDLSNDPDDAVIVRSTIELGHSLGLRLVAEGVEDDAALALLREWGCDTAQGYLLARPMPAAAVLPWLARYETRAALPAG